MATRFPAPAGPPWCFRGMPMVGCACIPTCRSTAAYRRRAMPIGGEGLEDRIQRSRDDRFWREADLQPLVVLPMMCRNMVLQAAKNRVENYPPLHSLVRLPMKRAGLTQSEL